MDTAEFHFTNLGDAEVVSVFENRKKKSLKKSHFSDDFYLEKKNHNETDQILYFVMEISAPTIFRRDNYGESWISDCVPSFLSVNRTFYTIFTSNSLWSRLCHRDFRHPTFISQIVKVQNTKKKIKNKSEEIPR